MLALLNQSRTAAGLKPLHANTALRSAARLHGDDMFAFGYLFGFVGLLVAVPVSAALGVLLRFALRNYRASTLYTGEPAS